MGRILQSSCGQMPATFFEKLASCVRVDPVSGDTYLNTLCYSVDCSQSTSAIGCGNAPIDPEQFCADNLFALDLCGNLALKILTCETNPQ